MPSQDPPENLWLDEDAGPVVRPYAMTRGRTRPATGEFDLISLISATPAAWSAVGMGFGPEHLAILAMCRSPLSVAEIAAHLDLPLGTVRVLLGDLLDHDLIVAQQPQSMAQLPSGDLFEAVINGLRAL